MRCSGRATCRRWMPPRCGPRWRSCRTPPSWRAPRWPRRWSRPAWSRACRRLGAPSRREASPSTVSASPTTPRPYRDPFPVACRCCVAARRRSPASSSADAEHRMPFTPSHAVVALPFVRTPLVPAAIAIGAVTPDLPLFLRGIGLDYGFTQQPMNIIWTMLIAFVLLLVWRVVLRPALVVLAPDALAARLPEEWRITGPGTALEVVVPRRRLGDPLLLVV